MITSKRPCDQTLALVHVFTKRRGDLFLDGPREFVRCKCGERPNAEEQAAYDEAVARHKREEAEAKAARIRRGE